MFEDLIEALTKTYDEGCRNCGCEDCGPAESGTVKCCDCCCDYRESWLDLETERE